MIRSDHACLREPMWSWRHRNDTGDLSGLPAEWINGWLAAVGATVLDARIRLHWMTDGVPLAVPLVRGDRSDRRPCRGMAGYSATV